MTEGPIEGLIKAAACNKPLKILTLYPGLHPDFISQPWRKVGDKVWVEAWVQGQQNPSSRI